MDSVFNILLWCLQILTAGVFLLQTCFDLFSNIAEKRRKQQSPVISIPDKPSSVVLSAVAPETQS